MKVVPAALLAALSFILLAQSNQAGEKKAKYTIAEVMKQAHKEGLLKAVLSGEASKEEKAKLVELYSVLPHNKPPRGEMEGWKELTANLVKAAEGVAKGDEAAPKLLMKYSACGACHSKYQKKEDE